MNVRERGARSRLAMRERFIEGRAAVVQTTMTASVADRDRPSLATPADAARWRCGPTRPGQEALGRTTSRISREFRRIRAHGLGHLASIGVDLASLAAPVSAVASVEVLF